MIVSKLDKNDCKDCSNPEKQTTVSPPAACEEGCIKILDSECIRSTSDVFCRGVEPNPLNDVIPVIADAVCMETLADFFVSRLEANSELAETLCTGLTDCPETCPSYSGTCTLAKSNEQFIIESTSSYGVSSINQQYTVRLQHKADYSKYKFELYIDSVKQISVFLIDAALIQSIDTVNNSSVSSLPTGTNVYVDYYIPPASLQNDAFVNLHFLIPIYFSFLIPYDRYNNKSCRLVITPICGDETLDTVPFDILFTTPDYRSLGYNVGETVLGIADFQSPSSSPDECQYELIQKDSTTYSIIEVYRDSSISLTTLEQRHNANVALGSSRVRFKLRLSNNAAGCSVPVGTFSSAITLGNKLFESDLGVVTNDSTAFSLQNNNRVVSYYEVDVYDFVNQTYVTLEMTPVGVSKSNRRITRYFPFYSSINLINTGTVASSYIILNITNISKLYAGLDLSSFVSDYAAATKPHITSVVQVSSSHMYNVNASLTNGSALNGLDSNQLKITLRNIVGGTVVMYVPLIAHVPSSTASFPVATPKMYYTDTIKITNLPSTITNYSQFSVGIELHIDDNCLRSLNSALPSALYLPMAFA